MRVTMWCFPQATRSQGGQRQKVQVWSSVPMWLLGKATPRLFTVAAKGRKESNGPQCGWTQRGESNGAFSRRLGDCSAEIVFRVRVVCGMSCMRSCGRDFCFRCKGGSLGSVSCCCCSLWSPTGVPTTCLLHFIVEVGCCGVLLWFVLEFVCCC